MLSAYDLAACLVVVAVVLFAFVIMPTTKDPQ